MKLSLDRVVLGAPEIGVANRFYSEALISPVAENDGCLELDLGHAGKVSLRELEALAAEAEKESSTSGFRGFVLSYIVKQPSQVEAVMDAAATKGGATVLKPAKKSLFGAFTGSFQAPDGSVWKLAAESKKQGGPSGDPPLPTEVGALLGVVEPKLSKSFYSALGMSVDRDYGNKYVDFLPSPGACRLGFLPRKGLAKDVGVAKDGSGFRGLVLNHKTDSPGEVDRLLDAASAAGGEVAVAAADAASGAYSGHFTDPDGYLWKVACSG